MCVRLSPKGGHPKLCLNHCSAGELVVSMSLNGVVRVKVSEETGDLVRILVLATCRDH